MTRVENHWILRGWMKMIHFSKVIEYPTIIMVNSTLVFEGTELVVAGITKVEPVTEKAILVMGYGEPIK